MPKNKVLFVITGLACVVANFGQNQSAANKPNTIPLYFKDTLYGIAFDSTTHHLGLIAPNNNNNNRVVKYIKNVSSKPIVIEGAWTSDPHYICEYPKEPLLPGKVYSFTVCFWHQGRQGMMQKTMGFYVNNGTRIHLLFTGQYLPVNKDNK